MVKREFQARYRNSVLGALWAVLHPLALTAVLAVALGRIASPIANDRFSYVVFLWAGLYPWNFFAEVVNRSATVFVDQANLLKKVSFPRATLPAIVLLSAAVNFGIAFAIVLVLLVVTGRFPGWPIVGIVPLLLVQQSLALGVGVGLGVLNVFFRDVAHGVAIGLQLWFWLTPIVYPAELLGPTVRQILRLNPLTQLVTGYQTILLDERWPSWSPIVFAAIVAGLALAAATMTFRRLADDMVDDL